MDSSTDRRSRADRPPAEQSLQQDDWTSAAAQLEWLVDIDAANEARDVDRLQGDSEMLLQLQLAGYKGKVWAYFSDVLARYGFAVLRAWLMRGVMLQKCTEKRLRGLPHNGLGRLDADGLAGETIAAPGAYAGWTSDR